MFKKLFLPFAVTGAVTLVVLTALILMIRQSTPDGAPVLNHNHATSADHAQCAAKIRGKSLPDLVLRDAGGFVVPVIERSLHRPLTLIRIPDVCAACREQLTALQRFNLERGNKGLQVIVFAHPDLVQPITGMFNASPSSSMVTVAADPANIAASQIGAVYKEQDGTITQLHGVLVVEKGLVTFVALDLTPYTKLQNLITFASSSQSP